MVPDPSRVRRLKNDVVSHGTTTVTVRQKPKKDQATALLSVDFRIEHPCICVQIDPDNRKPIYWLAHPNTGDAVIIEFRAHAPWLHLVEIKSRVSSTTDIQEILDQLVGAFLNGLAIAGVLELPPYAGITAHIAFTDDNGLQLKTAPVPSALRVRIGDMATPDPLLAEWNATDAIEIDGLPRPVELKKLCADRTTLWAQGAL